MSAPVIAITGATGYVGSLISSAVSWEGQIVRLVRTPRTEADVAWSLEGAHDGLAGTLRARGVTHLIHCAWDMQASTASVVKRNCVEGSARLFAAARAAQIKKLIFISTISAFPGARSTYGRSKLAVEDMALQMGGVVLRLGLVYGHGSGGTFGNLERTVARARFVPMIGDGRAPQHLLYCDTLAEVARRAVRGDFDDARTPLTIAQPEGIEFRALLAHLAKAQGKEITLAPLPWHALYLALRSAEALGLGLNFRSDSVISFVYQNPAPDFSALSRYAITPKRLAV